MICFIIFLFICINYKFCSIFHFILCLKIGLMRDGTLLAEESPNQLLLKHNCSTLEQAFLELSKRQTRNSIMDREDENCVCQN